MKNFKFFLPAMVFVMAIGMSFASIGLGEVQLSQYLATPSGCEEIDAVCDNTPDAPDCQVESASLGGPYEVFTDDTNPVTCSGTKLTHSGGEVIQIP